MEDLGVTVRLFGTILSLDAKEVVISDLRDGKATDLLRFPLPDSANFEYVEPSDADDALRPLLESSASSIVAVHLSRTCTCLLVERPDDFLP
jgi:hypothetical protein